jgi:glycosyltransferase involved in cell wall biosynthesis
MDILQVCPVYYPHVGGTEDHVRNISERLARKHEVVVFTTDPTSKLPEEEVINGVRVRRFKAFAPDEAYYFSPGMLRAIKKSKFDIVHGHDFHALPLFFSRYAKCKKLVVTPHYHGAGHTAIRNVLMTIYKPIGGKTLLAADKVICVSNYEKNLLKSDFNLADEKLVVIPNGLNLQEFEGLRRKRKEGHETILCVSRVERYKGIDYVVDALPRLRDHIELEIVGSGTHKHNLINQVQMLGLQRRVKFYENLSRRELLERYVNADVFVLLSRREAYGIVVAEALASRIPSIVANGGALKEFVDSKNCFGIGYPIDIEQLAGLINNVIGMTARTTKLLDWNEVVRSVELAYNSC